MNEWGVEFYNLQVVVFCIIFKINKRKFKSKYLMHIIPLMKENKHTKIQKKKKKYENEAHTISMKIIPMCSL